MRNRPDLGMCLRFNSVAIIALFQRPYGLAGKPEPDAAEPEPGAAQPVS